MREADGARQIKILTIKVAFVDVAPQGGFTHRNGWIRRKDVVERRMRFDPGRDRFIQLVKGLRS